MNARQCVLKILKEYEQHTVGLDAAINNAFNTMEIDRRDRRLIFEIVYGVIRNRLSLDYVINRLLYDRRFQRNRQLMRILRIGMYQIVYLEKIPDHAAVNESVRLAKNYSSTRDVSGVVNAVLRKIIKHKRNLPKPDKDEKLLYRLAVLYSHPQWMIQRWLDSFGLSNTKKILSFNNKRPDIFLRRKLKGLSRQQFESDIRSICSIAGNDHGYKNLFYRLNKSVLPGDIELFRDGYFTVQAESSGWIVALLGIQRGDKLLDVCSAPGGKTSLMAELTGQQGAVCACDIQFSRLKKVKQTILRMSLSNVFIVACNGEELPFAGCFDKVLLDAPCSGTGVINRHPDARWHRKPNDISRIVKVQRNLLDKVAPYIVSNGILVYATCSLEREENQSQVEDFLRRHKEFNLESLFGLVKENYITERDYLSINPYEHAMDGVFAARMRKVSY